jgi:hypothetical protein
VQRRPDGGKIMGELFRCHLGSVAQARRLSARRRRIPSGIVAERARPYRNLAGAVSNPPRSGTS